MYLNPEFNLVDEKVMVLDSVPLLGNIPILLGLKITNKCFDGAKILTKVSRGSFGVSESFSR